MKAILASALLALSLSGCLDANATPSVPQQVSLEVVDGLPAKNCSGAGSTCKASSFIVPLNGTICLNATCTSTIKDNGTQTVISTGFGSVLSLHDGTGVTTFAGNVSTPDGWTITGTSGQTLVNGQFGFAASAGGTFGSSVQVGVTAQQVNVANSSNALKLKGNMTDGAAAIGVRLDSVTDLANATSKVATFEDQGVAKASIYNNGILGMDLTDNGGVTGNQTINKPQFCGAFAAGTAQITITNSIATASTPIHCTLQTNDTTAIFKNAVPSSGSVQLNLSANATATTKVCCFTMAGA